MKAAPRSLVKTSVYLFGVILLAIAMVAVVSNPRALAQGSTEIPVGTTTVKEVDAASGVYTFDVTATGGGSVDKIALEIPGVSYSDVEHGSENNTVAVNSVENPAYSGVNLKLTTDLADTLYVALDPAASVKTGDTVTVQLQIDTLSTDPFAVSIMDATMRLEGTMDLASESTTASEEAVAARVAAEPLAAAVTDDFSVSVEPATSAPLEINSTTPSTLKYYIKVKNSGATEGVLPESVLQTFTLPEGMTIESASFTLAGQTITPTVNDGEYSFTPETFGTFTTGQTKTVVASLTVASTSKLALEVKQKPENYTCSANGGVMTEVSINNQGATSEICLASLTSTELEQASDGYTFLTDPVENPPLIQRCGLNVAIVFDLSNSIGADGLDQIKNTGNSIIEALQNTSVNIGLFNFGTDAPRVASAEQAEPLSMLDSTSAATLKNKISALNIDQGTGGTNWEGALQRVSDASSQYNTHYDVVYFVTDGVPTTNIARTGKDTGVYIHTADVDDAIKSSNLLKVSGTHLEVLAVNMPIRDIPLLKNEVFTNSNDAYNTGVGSLFVSNSTLVEGTNIVNQVRKVTRTGGRPQSALVDKNVWWAGDTTANDLLGLLAGPVWNSPSSPKYTPISSFDELTTILKEKIVGPCKAKLTIHKSIVDENGTKLSDGEDWSFTAAVEPGTGQIARSYDAQGNPVEGDLVPTDTKSTDSNGAVEFGVKADGNANAELTVTENIDLDSGYQLFQQGVDKKNATCSTVGTSEKTNVLVTNDGDTGFKLTMPYDNAQLAVTSVTCEVQNVEISNPKFKIEKVAYDPNSSGETKPLDGSEFALYFDKDGQPDYTKPAKQGMVAGTEYSEKLKAGDYWLVETKSPAGYQLLVEPVKLSLTYQRPEWSASVLDNSTLVSTGKENGVVLITVADIQTGTLPETGGDGIWKYVLVAAALFAGAVVVRRRPRNS